MIAGIVLAAGGSVRLGESKQLLQHGGVSLVRRATIAALDAGARPVIVVLGAEAERVAAALDGLDDVMIVRNVGWTDGLASSLASGLDAAAAMQDIDGALITLADQPLVNDRALRQLIDAFGSEQRIIASEYSDIIGVPVVIGREHFADLMRLEGDRGAGAWLRKRVPEVTAIPLSPPMLDIDTQEDAARLRAMDPLTTETS